MIRVYFWIFTILVSFVSTFVQAAEADDSGEVEEITYEQLVDRISQKKSILKSETLSAFDDVLIHASLGFVNSFSKAEVAGQITDNHHSGLQLSLGVNLFSPRWYSEAVWRNFGYQNQNGQEIGLRELDFRVGHQDDLSSRWRYRMGTGLVTRFLRISDAKKSVDIDATTPGLLVNFGLYASMNQFISLGGETSYRSPLVASQDRGSWDFTLQAITSF